MDLKHKSVVSRLEPDNEIIGTLHAVGGDDNCSKLQVSCVKELELPRAAVSLDKLHSLVGKRIGILNIEGKFFLREL